MTIRSCPLCGADIPFWKGKPICGCESIGEPLRVVGFPLTHADHLALLALANDSRKQRAAMGERPERARTRAQRLKRRINNAYRLSGLIANATRYWRDGHRPRGATRRGYQRMRLTQLRRMGQFA